MPPRTPVLVAGAGPTGLSAAYHLGADALLIEKNAQVGGWCRSIVHDGYTFDYAGHIMFSNDPYVHELYDLLLGDNVHWQDREAWIWSKNTYTRYPFQGALYGLPPEVIKECLLGAIEARYGLEPEGAPCSNGNGNGKALSDCCADGLLEATAPLAHKNGHVNGNGKASPAPESFEAFIHRVWGRGIAKHFALPYNRKLWKVPLSEMETSWLGGRVPMPDLGEMIDGALSPSAKPMGPNARFGYPLRGGFQALMDAFVPRLAQPPRLGTSLESVSPGKRTALLSDGSTVKFDALISTLPLPELVRRLGNEAPLHVRDAAAGLRHVSVRCVHLGVARPNVTDKHWIYYPEDPVFHRVFVQGNASPFCNPPGGFGLTCEMTYAPGHSLPAEGDALIERCIADARAVGLLTQDDVVESATQTDLPYAYVVYDAGRARRVAAIRAWLLEGGIHLAGRYSEWEYYNSDHAFLAGRRAAEDVRAASNSNREEVAET